MKKSYILFILLLLVISPFSVNASGGALRKNSIKTCPNGVTYGMHGSNSEGTHWHIAVTNGQNYYPSGESIASDPCPASSSNNGTAGSTSGANNNSSSSNNTGNYGSTGNFNNTDSANNTGNSNNSEENNPKEESKSNDNSLKAIIIDGEKIDIEENMKFSTTNKKINIEVSTNNEKATYKIKNNDILLLGENKIVIEVTAENGDIKTYNINVKRNKILSSNTGIKVIINNEEVKFDNYKSKVYVSSSTKKVNVDYTLNVKTSKVEMNELNSLKNGDNELKIKVIAEDGTEQIYEIIIYKYTYMEDIIYTIIGFAMFGGFIYGVYFIIKKVREKKISSN